MSGLFGMLSTTARSLDAQRYGLDSAGQNIANVNTPGYSRRVVDFGAVPPTSERLNAGNGVEVLGVRRLRDRFFDRRLFQENPAQNREAALAEALGLVEVEPRIARRHAERAAQPVLRRLQRARAGADVEHGARRRAGAGPGPGRRDPRHRRPLPAGAARHRSPHPFVRRRDQLARQPAGVAQRSHRQRR